MPVARGDVAYTLAHLQHYAGRFVAEQVAGDVLWPGTRDGEEAIGFLAAGPWDLIGHREVPETKTDGKIARLVANQSSRLGELQRVVLSPVWVLKPGSASGSMMERSSHQGGLGVSSPGVRGTLTKNPRSL